MEERLNLIRGQGLGTDAQGHGVQGVEAAQIGVELIRAVCIRRSSVLAGLAHQIGHGQVLTHQGVGDEDGLRVAEGVEHIALVLRIPVFTLEGDVGQSLARFAGRVEGLRAV